MPGCQAFFDRPADEVFRALSEAAEAVGEAEVLPGDISVAVMGPSVGLVAEVLARAVETLLAAGGPFAASLTFSEGWPEERRLAGPPASDPAGWEGAGQGTSTFKLACQYAVYPLGAASYTDVIEREMEAASASGLSMVRQNFSTRIEGTPREVFGWLAGAFDRARGEAAHVIVTAVMGPSLGKSQTFTLAS